MTQKIALIALFVLTNLTLFSQDIKSLRTEVTKAYKAGVTMNYDDIFETTYPKVFDIIPKEQMKGMFEQMMENDQFSIKLIEVTPNFSFGKIKEIEDKKFCLVEHDNAMEMTFKQPMDGEKDEMIENFKNNMNAKEVTYNKEKNAFTIKIRSTLIAVADNITNNQWKFLNKDKDNKLFTMIFDGKTKTALGL